MAWKNVKEHYHIHHTVHMSEGDICIGSAYVHDLIRISPVLGFTFALPPLSGDLARYWKEMEADLVTLRRLIDEPDTFSVSIPVYTYKGGEIIEKRCEDLGWPNITHDGEIMYENTFSADKAKVVAWAKRNAEDAIENMRGSIADEEKRLAERKRWLAGYEANLVKLETYYPKVLAESWSRDSEDAA